MTPIRRALSVAVVATLCLLAGCRSDSAGDAPSATADGVDATTTEAAWVRPLADAVARIDDDTPGDFGAYVRHFGEAAGTMDAGDDRPWYLSSTIKVPVAVAVLEAADAGTLSLDEVVVLKQTDFVDGSGDMLQHKPGERFTLATLLEKSLRDSDSTATDMLIRRIGEAHLNTRIRAWVGDGFGPITTILQVRYDAYGALHPGVAKLDNTVILKLRNAEAGEPRLQALADALGVERSALRAESLDAVFNAYYDSGKNAATLPAFARLLERVAAGELLKPESTARLLDHMRAITTGTRRIQAGLPAGTDFAQKTGTQLGRACNVGVIDPAAGRAGSTVVVACAEDFGGIGEAERAFEAFGRALGESGVVPASG